MIRRRLLLFSLEKVKGFVHEMIQYQIVIVEDIYVSLSGRVVHITSILGSIPLSLMRVRTTVRVILIAKGAIC